MTNSTPTSSETTGLVEEASQLVRDLWTGQLLFAAVSAGVFEHLGDEPESIEDIAVELGLHLDSAYRILRVLGVDGVLAEHQGQRFSLTPLGELFQEDHPDSMLPTLMFSRSPEYVSAMLHLPDIMREGGPEGFVREYGREIFDYLDDNPAFARRFNAFMTAASRKQTDLVLDALEPRGFPEISTVCDVGGGHGHLLCNLLETYPHLEGTILELPSVVNEGSEHWAPKLGVEDRCTYRIGDMFESIPIADAYILKWILHDWDDETCVQILSNIHDAAPADGRVFIAEAVIRGIEASEEAKRLDMPMLVLMGGRERTHAEYESLLAQADWELVKRWNPPAGPVSVIEARKA